MAPQIKRGSPRERRNEFRRQRSRESSWPPLSAATIDKLPLIKRPIRIDYRYRICDWRFIAYEIIFNRLFHWRFVLTQFRIPDIAPRVGRKKQWMEEMQARFAEGTFERIADVLGQNEDRTDFVRTAVDNEIRRRNRSRKRLEEGVPGASPGRDGTKG